MATVPENHTSISGEEINENGGMQKTSANAATDFSEKIVDTLNVDPVLSEQNLHEVSPQKVECLLASFQMLELKSFLHTPNSSKEATSLLKNKLLAISRRMEKPVQEETDLKERIVGPYVKLCLQTLQDVSATFEEITKGSTETIKLLQNSEHTVTQSFCEIFSRFEFLITSALSKEPHEGTLPNLRLKSNIAVWVLELEDPMLHIRFKFIEFRKAVEGLSVLQRLHPIVSILGGEGQQDGLFLSLPNIFSGHCLAIGRDRQQTIVIRSFDPRVPAYLASVPLVDDILHMDVDEKWDDYAVLLENKIHDIYAQFSVLEEVFMTLKIGIYRLNHETKIDELEFRFHSLVFAELTDFEKNALQVELYYFWKAMEDCLEKLNTVIRVVDEEYGKVQGMLEKYIKYL